MVTFTNIIFAAQGLLNPVTDLLMVNPASRPCSCSLQSELPGSACTSDGDCAYLANTVCRLKTSATSAASVKVKVCQCMQGFQPIPGEQNLTHVTFSRPECNIFEDWYYLHDNLNGWGKQYRRNIRT